MVGVVACLLDSGVVVVDPLPSLAAARALGRIIGKRALFPEVVSPALPCIARQSHLPRHQAPAQQTGAMTLDTHAIGQAGTSSATSDPPAHSKRRQGAATSCESRARILSSHCFDAQTKTRQGPTENQAQSSPAQPPKKLYFSRSFTLFFPSRPCGRDVFHNHDGDPKRAEQQVAKYCVVRKGEEHPDTLSPDRVALTIWLPVEILETIMDEFSTQTTQQNIIEKYISGGAFRLAAVGAAEIVSRHAPKPLPEFEAISCARRATPLPQHQRPRHRENLVSASSDTHHMQASRRPCKASHHRLSSGQFPTARRAPA